MIVTHKSIGLVGVQVSAGTNTKLDAFLFSSLLHEQKLFIGFPQKNVD